MVPLPCPRCGALPDPGGRFCGSCGERLTEAAIEEVPTTSRDANHTVPAPKPAPAPRPAPAPMLATAVNQAPPVVRPGPPLRPDQLIGRTLNNRYIVRKKIGEGGFGAVFEGKQLATEREVALKILHPQNVSDPTVIGRFRREAEACSKLRSPNTVTLYDFDETPDGTLYLAMELVRGRSLQQLQRREGPLSTARVLKILRQVTIALREAHEQGIVHRDMKPENVMIETRGEDDFVKVLDFGIAKIVSGDGAKKPALTAIGQTVGTLEFMSPEQLRGKPLDGRSDIYGLGMMAFEMLTGELPFKATKVTTDIINFHLNKQPDPPSRLTTTQKIAPAIDALVLKMVGKSPNDRHANADELLHHIDEALASLDTRANKWEAMRVALVIGGLVVLLAGAIALLSR
jgi:serine/threonine-protein kinase